MYTKRIFIISIILVFSTIKLSAQDLTQIGILPKAIYSKPLNEHFGLSFTAFSEIDPYENTVGDIVFPDKVINLTFVGGVSYKFSRNNSLTAGYLFRIIDPFRTDTRIEHRFISQFIHVQHLGDFRLRHHLKFEERFIERIDSNIFDAITRLSYSFAWDVPLQGKELNVNEFYLNSISSYYVQTTRPRTAFNNLTEFYLGLGYKTKNIGRFEIGPEAKIAVRNVNGDLNALIFIDFVWFLDFKKKN